jgi:toxin ParE1/3/4
VRWSDPALDDLGAIHDYIAADNPVAAYRVIARIEDATANLDTFPEVGRIGRRRGTRERRG